MEGVRERLKGQGNKIGHLKEGLGLGKVDRSGF